MKYKESRSVVACPRPYLCSELNKRLHSLLLIALLTGLSVLFSKSSFAQPVLSPDIQCIQSVNTNDLSISWQAGNDPSGNFIGYHIYQATNSGGPFVEIAVINNVNANNYLVLSPTPLGGDRCFYIQAENLVGGIPTLSPAGEVFCSIFLNVSPSAAPQGFAFLDWNNPSPNAQISGEYVISMEYPAGTWTEIAYLPQDITSYNHEISTCNEVLNFQVVYETAVGCDFVSNIDGELLTDLTPPAIPVVTSVSIDHTTNDAVISWNASQSADCQGYILYNCNSNGSVSLIDTIFGINNTQFIDLLAPTSTGPVSYLLAAIDTCYSGTPPSPNTSPAGDVCNESIYISPIGYAVCSETVDINWTPYIGWEDGVAAYEIYHRFGTDPYVLIASVPGNQLTYTHNVTVGGVNSYYIRGVSNTGGYTAISNLQNVQVTYPVAPSFTYITSVSVWNNDTLHISVITEAVGSDHFYTLERQRTGTNDWDEMITVNNLGAQDLFFEDGENISADFFTYEYRLIVENVCEDIVDTSNLAISCLLNGFAYNDRLANALQWTDYVGFDQGVSEYRIHRKMGTDGADMIIGTVSGSTNYYEDDVSGLEFSPGDFIYRIEAVSAPSSDYPDIYTAWSNEIRLSLEPVIWVPNAFVVDGFNKTFGPVIRFADYDNYRMLIYSRWGDVIYDTNDIAAPWDGFMNGEPVQEGVYVYYIQIKDGKGRLEERRGTVTLLTARDQ